MSAPSPDSPAWSWPIDQVAASLSSDRSTGLTAAEAQRRHAADGPNSIQQRGQRSWTQVLFSQFANVMVLLLAAAAIISLAIGEWTDAILIGIIVIANAIVGFTQEWSAERAVEALRQMAEPTARVCRDGAWQQHPAVELVRGDLIELSTGTLVPADARLIDCVELETSEAALTGESHPVTKQASPQPVETGLSDRHCMVFSGTSVVNGHGRALVTQIGSQTELGRIAELLESAQPAPTPLQQRLDALSRKLSLVIVGTAVVMFAIGFQRHGLGPMLLMAVGLAVAALPEGLPAVITIGLAIGAKRMAQRKAIIRRLTAVETLGSVNVICTDKTGTLTQNQMSVSEVKPATDEPLVRETLLHAAVLCNDAVVQSDGTVLGSPTERAFVVYAQDEDVDVGHQRDRHPRTAELPFSSERKRMSTLHRVAEGHVLYVKGALERVLPSCNRLAGTDQPVPEGTWRELAEHFAGQGQRVLAFARRVWDGRDPPETSEWDHSLEFLGLVAITDPVRPEVPEAIARCQSAGILPVLITGDHPETARSISEQIGIWKPGQSVLTGPDVDRMSDDELQQAVATTTVYARVAPEHKLRIVRSHQAMGSVTSMTGDGVNDAPALKQADIGVAMGQNGTEVAKESSAMILSDDNFATIVAAVEEGRAVFDNIRKSIAYLFAGNSAEVLLLFGAVLIGLPLPLIPIQILWINLVTDGLPALALAFEPPEANVMRRAPRGRQEGLFGHGLGWGVLVVGSSVAIALMLLFRSVLAAHPNSDAGLLRAQTAVFMALGLAELFYATSARDLSRALDPVGFFRNRWLVGAVAVGGLLQFSVCYLPILQPVFHTVSLSLQELLLCAGVGLTGVVVLEAWKQVVLVSESAGPGGDRSQKPAT